MRGVAAPRVLSLAPPVCLFVWCRCLRWSLLLLLWHRLSAATWVRLGCGRGRTLLSAACRAAIDRVCWRVWHCIVQ